MMALGNASSEGSIRRPPQKMREALRPLTLANTPAPVKTSRGWLLCNPPPPNLPPSARPDSVVVAKHIAPVTTRPPTAPPLPPPLYSHRCKRYTPAHPASPPCSAPSRRPMESPLAQTPPSSDQTAPWYSASLPIRCTTPCHPA